VENKNQYKHILLIKDSEGQRKIELTANNYSLGRSPQCEIVINDRKVSRYHATIIKKQKPSEDRTLYIIIDGDVKGNRSLNGISINGYPKSFHQLKDGDEISLGNQSQSQQTIKIQYSVIATEGDLEEIRYAGRDVSELGIGSESIKPSGIIAKRASYKQTVIIDN